MTEVFIYINYVMYIRETSDPAHWLETETESKKYILERKLN
jgi:hypothetical protein